MRDLLRPLSPTDRERREIESVLEDLADWPSRSLHEKDQMLRNLLSFASQVISDAAQQGRMRNTQDHRSPESESLWRGLVEQHSKR